MQKAGDIAPNFALLDQNGNRVELADFKGKKNVALFFYPRDNTPGCTAESCSFRDNHLGFQALGAQILGISADSVESHKGFAQKNQLPYPILSDEGGKVGHLYGVKGLFGLFPGRATFVIDKNGIIRHAFSSQFLISRHIDETLRIMQQLAQEDTSAKIEQRLH